MPTCTREKCQKCKGSMYLPAGNGGAYSCTACGGSGLSAKARKERALENKMRNITRYKKETERINELKLAIEQFEVKTNLDGVLLQEIKEWHNTLVHRRQYLTPKERELLDDIDNS